MGGELHGVSVTAIPKHDKHAAYNKSEKGQARYAKQYMERQFVAWDGEGINEADRSHTYVLLANSLGTSLTNRNGLSTCQVFDLFLSYSGDKCIHVIYGGNYDFNMIVRDLDKDSLYALYVTGRVWWNGYGIEWRGGKSFSVRKNGQRFLIYDVLPFFQRSFVSACDEYLGKDWPYRDEIIAGKAQRGDFDYDDITSIGEYNAAELDTLVRLCVELRDRLHKVAIRVNRWDGPGAIASALYKRYGVKSSMCETPTAVNDKARFGYAGGRFEIIRKGHSDDKTYQYDIRSAYPSAMRYLPCLTHGSWRHVIRPTSIVPFGIYRIEVAGTQVHPTRPQPLWSRNAKGNVYFKDNPHGWYWSPEAQIGTELPNATVHEGWEYETRCGCDPFGFVEPLYMKRAALKKAGDGAHVGLKLGLNSLYGKLAQQIGWDPGPPLRLPPFHCLEWAGWVTSHCRSQVYRAAMTAPDDIIAFETDAVFSRVPLDVKIGERLGEWDETIYENLTYLKSGMYWGETFVIDKETGITSLQSVEKSRGINKGSISRNDVIHELRNGQQKLHAEQSRFITLGQALHQNFDLWTHWVTSPRLISTELWGKRIDVFDSRDNYARTGDGWEETISGPDDTVMSVPYEVEWLTEAEILSDDGLDLHQVKQFQSHLAAERML